MESTDKLTDTNAILAYLYETFPLCFIAEGQTKPLKIGLFQELAERLADDSKVSKTQLRIALRRYTSSWRYLKGVKAGAQRIDLEGKECGELEQEHIEHAQSTLKESQEKAKAKRVAKAVAAKKEGQAAKQAKELEPKRSNLVVKKPAKALVPVVNLTPAVLNELKQNQRVNVKLGKLPVSGIIIDIKKRDVQVQLDSGLTIKVSVDHIML
ncbi:MAG: RNA chaperone ProQ [Shewanella sp.]